MLYGQSKVQRGETWPVEAALHGLDKPEFCSFGAVGRWLHWSLKFLFCKVRRLGVDKIFRLHFSAFTVWFCDFEMEWLGWGPFGGPRQSGSHIFCHLFCFTASNSISTLKRFKHQLIILIYLDGFENTVRRQHCTMFFKYIFWSQWNLGLDLGPLSAPSPWSSYLTASQPQFLSPVGQVYSVPASQGCWSDWNCL